MFAASVAVGVCKRQRTASCSSAPNAKRHAPIARIPPLLALSDGPCAEVLSWLNAQDLGRADAACRALLELGGRSAGPWELLGARTFRGIELDEDGGQLFGFQSAEPYVREGGLVVVSGSWKRRCRFFTEAAPTFGSPFASPEIRQISKADELAYCRCRLRTDVLAAPWCPGVYVEVDVRSNADNLSLAVMDFEGGGSSSVTFSPETGAVLRERKVKEEPRVIEGSYIQLLPIHKAGRRFEGRMGIFVQGGQLAFFRRWNVSEPKESEAQTEMAEQPLWETTGFCTDLSWAQGDRLSICLAFRDEGAYNVKLARVGPEPPLKAVRNADAFNGKKWNLLYGDDDVPLAM